MKLVVGLGNPGKEYARTRHNVGFLFVDYLAEKYEGSFKKNGALKGEVAKIHFHDTAVLLLKPTTYMNDSGEAVAATLSYYKLAAEEMVIVHDDKDVPLGEMRVQTGRGAAGHNGVLSIFEKTGTRDFTRVRMGIAPAGHSIADTASFVLSPLTKPEQQALRNVFEHAEGALVELIS